MACPSHHSRAVAAMSTCCWSVGSRLRAGIGGREVHACGAAQTLKGALERAGYEVVEAEDAASALARLGERPDLVVLAGAIPDMELLEFCAALRRDPAAERIPFVLVAEAAARTGRAAARAGADLVFPATVGPTEIAERLRRLLLGVAPPDERDPPSRAPARRVACPGRPRVTWRSRDRGS